MWSRAPQYKTALYSRRPVILGLSPKACSGSLGGAPVAPMLADALSLAEGALSGVGSLFGMSLGGCLFERRLDMIPRGLKDSPRPEG
jgi:hypothetical protein